MERRIEMALIIIVVELVVERSVMNNVITALAAIDPGHLFFAAVIGIIIIGPGLTNQCFKMVNKLGSNCPSHFT